MMGSYKYDMLPGADPVYSDDPLPGYTKYRVAREFQLNTYGGGGTIYPVGTELYIKVVEKFLIEGVEWAVHRQKGGIYITLVDTISDQYLPNLELANDDQDHTGMIQGFDGEWRWL